MQRLYQVLTALMVFYCFSCNTETGSRNAASAEMQALTKFSEITDSISEPGARWENYAEIIENKFIAAASEPVSTFSADVDDASYSNVRRFINEGQLPPKDAVRIEEMINYFNYPYIPPTGKDAFSIYTELATCPWNTRHKLLHVGIKGREVVEADLPSSNLVFLVDVSGSMDEPNKLPLVQASLSLLTDKLRPQDKVAIVVYAGAAGLVLPSTNGDQKTTIKAAVMEMNAGGSTAGAEGIELAYKTARENFIKGGNNRVILCTDGDFNVGPSSDDALLDLITKKRASGIMLSVLGFGRGNYQDAKMQLLADKGNGNHSYIDTKLEAEKVLVREFGSTLFTIAKDVKIQLAFNPGKVRSYRLIGYENRLLAAADFDDDQKDAGETGSGHTVTALYEIIPEVSAAPIEPAYTSKSTRIEQGSWLTLSLRYKQPEASRSILQTHPVTAGEKNWQASSPHFRFAAAVAEFGLLLRNSAYREESSFAQVQELAKGSLGEDKDGFRKEFLELVRKTGKLSRQGH